MIFYCLMFSRDYPFVHECLANMRSLLAHFLQLFIKTARNCKFFASKNGDFCHFEYSAGFLEQILSGGTFNFWSILANFHEYISR